MTYSKSPLVEAVVEIRTEESGFPFESLSRFDELVRDRYPRAEVRIQAEGQFLIQKEPTATIDKKPFSRMYFSEDNKQIFQAKTDGIVLSRLTPYESWSVFYPELQRLWGLYKSVVKPKPVSRIAARYINHLKFDGERLEIEEYLNTYPKISDSLPLPLRDMGHYWLHIQSAQFDIGGVMIMNQGVLPPTNSNTITVVLDFDLYMDGLQLRDDESVWAKLDQIRQRKNLYFEACITDKLRAVIK